MLEVLGKHDLQDVLDLYRHLHRTDPPVAHEVAEQRWDEILAVPGHFVFGVREGGQLIGSCVLQIVPNLTRGARPYGLVENVVVHADHRRRGIGTAMMGAVLRWAWDADCYKVMLLTGSQSAEAFYDAVGFDGSAKRGYVARPS